MKLLLTIALLLLSLNTLTPVVLGQKVTCSCEKLPGKCGSTVTCSDGCTSFCGAGNTCYVSCRKEGFEPRITIRIVKKTGQEIASVLSAQTRQRIEFVPYKIKKYKGVQYYDLEMKNDDIFNALSFLAKRGVVKIDGVPFEEFKNLLMEKRGRKTIVP